jgi:hypothetical protein
MVNPIWRSANSRENFGPLPIFIRGQLEWRYGIGQDVLDRLKCARKRTSTAVDKVLFVRVFDPQLLAADSVVLKYQDLDGRSPALMFEVKLRESGRFAQFKDLRHKEEDLASRVVHS